MRIIEATSGNTGIGLAVIGRLLGYETTLVMPPQVSRDRREILESAGAEIIWSDPAKRWRLTRRSHRESLFRWA